MTIRKIDAGLYVEEHEISVHNGWGVSITPVWDEDEESVHDIDVNVVEIRQDAVRIIGAVPCVVIDEAFRTYVPVENFRKVPDLSVDDTHDLRTRWFATEREAREHAASVEDRWRNPEPWCAFVALGE